MAPIGRMNGEASASSMFLTANSVAPILLKEPSAEASASSFESSKPSSVPSASSQRPAVQASHKRGGWTAEEHEKLISALNRYPDKKGALYLTFGIT